MKPRNVWSVVLVCLMLGSVAAPGLAQTEQKPTVQIPQAGVPEIMTIEGTFVRAAWNAEGYVILGYRLANESLGGEWMLLEVGMTTIGDTGNYTLKRDAISLSTPDGGTVPLPTQSDYLKANLRSLEMREEVIRDTINYFPPSATQGCRIGFFAPQGSRGMAYDQVELSTRRACLGRLYFPVAGGIKYGQYWLNVKFEQGLVRVPFRILTEEEEKLLQKNYKDIRKQVQEAFKPKKK